MGGGSQRILVLAPVYSTNFSITGGAAGAPLANFDGAISGFKMVNWSITPSTKYPADCNCPNPGAVLDANLKQGSEVVELIAPGSRLTPRQNQLDMAVRKTFHIRRNTAQPARSSSIT